MTVSFNKSRSRWTFDFQHKGKRYQGYCLDAAGDPVTSKSAARQAEGVEKRRADMAPKVADPRDITVAQVVASLQPRWKRSATWPDKQRQAREIVAFFGAASAVRELIPDRIRAYVEFALAQPVKVWMGGPGRDRDDDALNPLWRDTGRTRAPATVNRYLSLVRQIVTRAGEMRGQDGRPVLDFVPQVPELPEMKRRARPAPEPVLQRLMAILPPHVIDAVVVTLFFGFRKGEAFRLQDPHVDWEAAGVRLFAEDVKDSEDAFLPGSQEAMGYLRCLAMEADQRGTRHLITYRPAKTEQASHEALRWRPIKSPKSAWATAMKIIKAEFGAKWRWHDIRAAYITHVAITSGAVAAQTMARHSNYETTRAYIEVADETRRVAAERTAERPALMIVRGPKNFH